MVSTSLAVALSGACGEDSQPPCPNDPLLGIYQPARLEVLGECAWYRGTVRSVDQRNDGDYHLEISPAPGYEHFLASGNLKDTHEALVVEIVPGQHLQLPKVGEQVGVFGTWVYDTHNDWNEIHPVWSIDYPERAVRSDVLPPPTPLYEGNADD